MAPESGPAEVAVDLRWTDQHCHLDPATADSVVAECRESGVLRLIDVGTDRASSQVAIEMSERFEEVWSTVGVHPHDARHGLDGIEELLAHPRVVAVGECGLDYHYDHSPREVQRQVFAEQIAMAHAHDLALVIHTREAWEDTLAMLEEHWKPTGLGGIMHCFSGGPADARRCLDLGFHLSFAGIVTFPKATELQEAARLCPTDRMLIETDAPYLAPVPYRGKRNEPAYVAQTAAKLAELRGTSTEEIVRATTENFEHLLNSRISYGFR